MRLNHRLVQITVLAIACLVLVVSPGSAADHLDAPFVSLDGRIDINDVYVFPGADPTKQVFVMTVNPGAGSISGETFRPDARYEFLLDTDGNAVPNITIRTSFGAVQSDGTQSVRVQKMETGQPAETLGGGITGTEFNGTGMRAIVDTFDDPFFFDLDAFNGTDGRAFCDGNEVDFFAGLNVSAIILEVDSTVIDAPAYSTHAVTRLRGLQADRMGIPAINTVFIPSNPFEPTEAGLKDAFNHTLLVGDDGIWAGELRDTFEQFYSDSATIDFLVDVLLPDALPFDENVPPGFEFLNGRGLADDVIDLELGLVTNGAVLSDCVDANDVPFLNDFPYLAQAN